MKSKSLTVLVVGATGSIGRLVVEEALRQGHAVRALARDLARSGSLPDDAQRDVGDLTTVETLAAALDGIDAIVFTHGADGGGKTGVERVCYGGVRNVLMANAGRPLRIALMTAIGVTDRLGSHNRSTEAHELVAERGPATTDFDALFASLDPDPAGALDGVLDADNMPSADEPARVREDLQRLAG
jgi:uncharacterized protein YbjT (DUF2867 family)